MTGELMEVVNFTEMKENHEFLDKYIKKKRPVVVKKYPHLARFQANFTPENLCKRYGSDMKVLLERKKNGRFGQTNADTECTLEDFLKGRNDLYLTSSWMSKKDESISWHPLLDKFRNDFPTSDGTLPQLTDGLRAVRINVWCGSSHGTSSGFHHDYQDNLYYIIKGCKTFELFEPEHWKLYRPVGTVARVHDTGIINYWEDDLTDQVGKALSLQKQLDIVQQRMDDIQRDIEAQGRGKRKRQDQDLNLEELLEILDRRAEVLLEQIMASQDGDDEECIAQEGESAEIFDEEEDEDQDQDEEGPQDEDEEEKDSNFSNGASSKDAEQEDAKERPLNFSLCNWEDDVDRYLHELVTKHKCKKMVVELEEGDILFLPAGWWHNVTSKRKSAQDVKTENNLMSKEWPETHHCALNFWYSPMSSQGSAMAPYHGYDSLK